MDPNMRIHQKSTSVTSETCSTFFFVLYVLDALLL